MITSTSNGKIKEVVQLQKKSKYRRDKGLYIVEGIKMFSEADKDYVEAVYVTEEFMTKASNKELLMNYEYEVVSENVMKAMSDTVTPQGILCVMRRFAYDLNTILSKKSPRLMLLADLQDPGNAGTIIRSAEGAGMDGVIFSNGSVDLYNPKTIRSTMGSIYRVPFAYGDLSKVIESLKEKRVPIYTTDMNGTSYREAEYRNGFAIIIGNEANGVSNEIASMADSVITIPMCGQVESLNASIAASLVMYEACYKATK